MTDLTLPEPAARDLQSRIADHAYALSSTSWAALAALCALLARATHDLDQHGADR